MATKRSRLILVLAGALLAVACSGGGGSATDTPPPTPEAKLSIAYSALITKVGDAVSLTAQLENAAGPVAWSLSGPGSLSAAEGEQVTFQAEAEGTASVTAAAAGLKASVTISVKPGPGPTTMTVNGIVLNTNGDPVVNESVFIPGVLASMTHTNGAGQFTIPGVTPPYDLAVVVDSVNAAFVYRGLQSATPTLYVFVQPDQTNLPPQTSTMTGLTTGGDAAPVNDINRVGFVSPEVKPALNPGSNVINTLTIPGIYDLTVNWSGPLNTTGTLVGIQVHPDPGTGAPLNYWYAQAANVQFTGGQTALTGPTLAFNPVATLNTQGNVTLAPNYALNERFLALTFPDGNYFPFFQDTLSPTQPHFEYIVPALNGVTSQVCATAFNTVPLQSGFSATCIDALAPGGPTADLMIRAAPQPINPANLANAVLADTTFSWSPFADGVHMLFVLPAPATPPNPIYFIFTAGTQTTIPDLGISGLKFATGDYLWDVAGFAPFASLDDFTATIPPAAVALKNGLPPSVPPVPDSSVGFSLIPRVFHHP